jgi:serine/threonine protein kinase
MILHRKNSSGYGQEVDWWSLGIVCFELLTGWPPFYDRDFHRMCEKILYRPLNFPAQKYNLTRGAEDLIRSLLQRDPAKRLHFQPGVDLVEPGPKDKQCLQKHVFFEGMEWERLMQCAVEPPFVPPRAKDVSDTCNFDREFTKLSIKNSSDRPRPEDLEFAAQVRNLTPPLSLTHTHTFRLTSRWFKTGSGIVCWIFLFVRIAPSSALPLPSTLSLPRFVRCLHFVLSLLYIAKF